MKKLSDRTMKYTKHEYGIESECGQYMLENMEECMEELNELLKQRNEAREMAEWMREMMDTWAECDDTSFPWDNHEG